MGLVQKKKKKPAEKEAEAAAAAAAAAAPSKLTPFQKALIRDGGW